MMIPIGIDNHQFGRDFFQKHELHGDCPGFAPGLDRIHQGRTRSKSAAGCPNQRSGVVEVAGIAVFFQNHELHGDCPAFAPGLDRIHQAYQVEVGRWLPESTIRSGSGCRHCSLA